MRHTHSFKLMVLAAALTAGSFAMAQEGTAPRAQRMDEALQNYRAKQGTQGMQGTQGTQAPGMRAPVGDPRNPNPGPAARAEDSIKRGARSAGHAVKDGAERAGHAVGTGVEKTGAAIRRTGEKIKDKVEN